VEVHNEFACVTCIVADPDSGSFASDPWAVLPQAQLAALPGECVVNLRVDLLPSATSTLGRADLEPIFGDQQFIAGQVSDGKGAVWSDLRGDATRTTRILILDVGLSERRCGRLLQRVLDIGTYLSMSLLGLGEAREVQPRTVTLSSEVEKIAADIADHATPTKERPLMERLGDLSAEVEHLRARTARRFNATPAYGEIVHARLGELRETKIAGFQTWTEFISRRLQPGLRTVTSVRANLDDLAKRLQRTADLLRTRIDLTLADQNRDLLASMDRRAALQIRLQETVEGLSVFVLSYYLVGLIKYVALGTKPYTHVDSDLVAAVAVPLALVLVFWGMRRVRKSLHQHP
jgi:uncharacterized membrane-anchored protein